MQLITFLPMFFWNVDTNKPFVNVLVCQQIFHIKRNCAEDFFTRTIISVGYEADGYLVSVQVALEVLFCICHAVDIKILMKCRPILADLIRWFTHTNLICGITVLHGMFLAIRDRTTELRRGSDGAYRQVNRT